MLPYLLLWGSQLEPLSLGLPEPYLWGKKGEKGTLPLPMPEEKLCDSKTPEWQEKNLVPLRLRLSEQATNSRTQQYPEANEVPLLSPSAQEFLEMHITEKIALHIWKEKELLSQPRPDIPPCFHRRELKKLSLVLEDRESSVKDLWTPDPEPWGASGIEQSFLGSERSLVNTMKQEHMPNSRQLHRPISLILAPTTLHFLNRLCSMPGRGAESTLSHNRQCIQLFWGLPSLHSESLATTYMGSSSSSWLGTTIKLPPGDNPLVFFNDLSYLHLPGSASQPSLPSSTQHLTLLPPSYPTLSRSPSPFPLLSPTLSPPSPSPSLPSSSPHIRTFKTDPEESPIKIPTIYLPRFQALEWHLLQKQLQSLWGVPRIVQRSHEAFNPLPLQLPQIHKAACPQVHISNWPQELPFISKDVKKILETHLRRRLVQHHWGLARRVEDSIKHLAPQTIPQQDPSSPRKPKSPTFEGLKRSGKKDMASDSAADLGTISAIILGTGPVSHAEESSKSDLEKSPSPSQQEVLQKHLLQKSVAIQQKVVPESVSRSWATARGRSVSLQPTQPSQRPPKMREIVPPASSTEDTATQTQPQPHLQPEMEPPPRSQPQAPSPTEEVIYEVEPCKDIPFLNPETKKVLESHIRHMHIRLKWGLPKKVLESIYLFKLKNSGLLQATSPTGGRFDSRVGERNLQEIWVGGVAREASAVVLDILEAEKGSWNIGKELWEAPQAGGDWEENTFLPRSSLMHRGPRKHISEIASRREILELNMKHPVLLPRQKNLASSFRKQLQAPGTFPLFKDNEGADSDSICLLKSSCVLNKSNNFSKLNFHLKKRMVEKVLGIPLRVRESREMATRPPPPSCQLREIVAAEESESVKEPLPETDSKEVIQTASLETESKEVVQMAEGQTLALRTQDTQDLSCLIYKAQFANEEEFDLKVLEPSYEENLTKNTLVQPCALGFQAPEIPPSYTLGQPNKNLTSAEGLSTLVKVEEQSPGFREYQKLHSQVIGKNRGKLWLQSQRKGNYSKLPRDQGMGLEKQEKDPNLLKGHTYTSRWPPQGPMSSVLGFPKQEGVLQRKISLEMSLMEKMKGFFNWLRPKKKIKGTKEPLARGEVAIAETTANQSPFTVRPLSKGNRAPFGSPAPSAPEDMTVVGLILEKKMGSMDDLYSWEEEQQQERELQMLDAQTKPSGKYRELRALPSARPREGNGKSSGHGKRSAGHWSLSWERQAQDREKRVKNKKTVRFRDQHLPPEKLASIASEMSISSGQFRCRQRGSRFSRTLGHSQHHAKPPLRGSYFQRSPGPSPQYGVFWLPTRESSFPGDNLFS
ncbi:uncharacterized protein LOC141550058 [Sminthopsis crassicaudata]|uniref:uncharacterized protein LOC141550058 n=1 Tax=Sminthopsis crassicaudata TaxID=9301 RepID=UPI003D688D9E